MAVTIGSNITSIRGQRLLDRVTDSQRRTYERLASGQRINRASDDAAGLAVASSLDLDSRVFNQGLRNVNDGISLLNIADAATQELTGIVIRIRELATQASNGTFQSSQRAALDIEAQALSKEYVRIAQSTSFNGMGILNGSVQEVRVQGGYGLTGSLGTSIGGVMGDGTFDTAVSSVVALTAQSKGLAVNDLNADGNIDRVFVGGTDGGAGFLAIQLGTGTGSFGTITTISSEAAGTEAVTLADVNNDGILDIATAGGDATDGYATIFLGRGNGTFTTGTSYLMESTLSKAIDFADLNGDGLLDLVTAGSTDLSAGYATVRLGTGSGTFGAAQSYAMETGQSKAVKLRDLNNDGIVDLITGGDHTSTSGWITVRLGNGNGTFRSATSYAMNTAGTSGIELADLNGDGYLDIGSSGRESSLIGTVQIRLGRGDGTFNSATSYSAEENASNAITFGDVNGDGITDLLSSGYNSITFRGNISVRIGAGNGTFGAIATYQMETTNSYGVKLADLNNDGVLDVVTSGRTGSNDAASTARLGLTRNGVAALLPFSLRTATDARLAMPLLDQKLRQLSQQSSTIGSFQSRLTVTANNLQSSAIGSSAASARIMDTDIAEDTADLTRQQILQQASAAILAQANLQPQIALNLLRA